MKALQAAPVSLAAFALLLVWAGPTGAQEVAGSSADRDAVLAVVHRFFDGMRAHDSAAIRITLHPDASLATTGTKNGEPTVEAESIDAFLSAIAGSKRDLDERIHDPEVRLDGGLASVWTAYDFYLDGAFSHCGVDAFQLGRTAEGWKIVHIMDTRRKGGCKAGAG